MTAADYGVVCSRQPINIRDDQSCAVIRASNRIVSDNIYLCEYQISGEIPSVDSGQHTHTNLGKDAYGVLIRGHHMGW
jgi:hypothetical protein